MREREGLGASGGDGIMGIKGVGAIDEYVVSGGGVCRGDLHKLVLRNLRSIESQLGDRKAMG